MLYVHRWDLGDRGKLFMVTEETTPKGTVSLGTGYEGTVKSNPKKIIKILEGAPVTKEEVVKKDDTGEETIEAPKAATVANVLRKFAQDLEEK